MTRIPQTVGFDFVEVFKVGTALRAGASMLPVGVQPAADPLRVAPVQPSVALENSVLAVRRSGCPPVSSSFPKYLSGAIAAGGCLPARWHERSGCRPACCCPCRPQVSHATSPEEVLAANVAGFVYVTAVDMVRQRYSRAHAFRSVACSWTPILHEC